MILSAPKFGPVNIQSVTHYWDGLSVIRFIVAVNDSEKVIFLNS